MIIQEINYKAGYLDKENKKDSEQGSSPYVGIKRTDHILPVLRQLHQFAVENKKSF